MSRKHILSNGATILVEKASGFQAVALTLCFLGGSGDETREDAGLSHLLEHLLFKRTKRKNTLEIASLIDELGSDINAFTDTESMCLTAEVPKEELMRVLEFFTELCFENDFTEEDLRLEKEVIRQEIIESEDDPEQAVYQRFSELFWPKHSIGRPVFGYRETVGSFLSESLQARRQELLQGSRIVLAVAGDVDEESVLSFAEKKLSSLLPGARPQREPATAVSGMDIFEKPVSQVHLVFGRPIPTFLEEGYYDGLIASNIFGGGMSSRLFQTLREKQGLAYDVGCEVDEYYEGASHLCNITLERSNLNLALKLIVSEFEKLAAEGFSAAEIELSKKAFDSQLRVERDSLDSRLWRMLESEIHYSRFKSVEESRENISKVSAKSLEEYLHQYFLKKGGFLVFGGDVERYEAPTELINRLI